MGANQVFIMKLSSPFPFTHPPIFCLATPSPVTSLLAAHYLPESSPSLDGTCPGSLCSTAKRRILATAVVAPLLPCISMTHRYHDLATTAPMPSLQPNHRVSLCPHRRSSPLQQHASVVVVPSATTALATIAGLPAISCCGKTKERVGGGMVIF